MGIYYLEDGSIGNHFLRENEILTTLSTTVSTK